MWVCKLGALTCDYIKAFEDNIISKLKGDFPIIWGLPSRPYSGCLSRRWKSRSRDRQHKSLVGLTGFSWRGDLWAVETFVRFNRMCFSNVGNLRSGGARQLSRYRDPINQPSNSSSCWDWLTYRWPLRQLRAFEVPRLAEDLAYSNSICFRRRFYRADQCYSAVAASSTRWLRLWAQP